MRDKKISDISEESSQEADLQYQNIYEQAAGKNMTGTIDFIKEVVDNLGNGGFISIDAGNQVDMTNADKAMAFVEAAENGKEAEITILSVL